MYIYVYIYIHAIMKTMCPPDYHHNDFVQIWAHDAHLHIAGTIACVLGVCCEFSGAQTCVRGCHFNKAALKLY